VLMSGDDYLQQLLAKITAPTGVFGPGEKMRQALDPMIRRWAGTQYSELKVSGSYAKGTAIRGGTDVDIFISLKPDTSPTLKEIFDSLASYMTAAGYSTRKQNVSIGISHGGYQVDLVPGKRQNFNSRDHSLWVSRQNTWQKTNIDTHIDTVSRSSHTDVIRVMKRWKQCHGLEFPSFALELATLRALAGRNAAGRASRVMAVVEWLRDNITAAALIDPANTNNNVASELSATEKIAIARQAKASRDAAYWKDVVW